MRKIKFRVWCLDKKQWEDDNVVLTPDGKLYREFKLDKIWRDVTETHIVEISTGLKDVYGKEIYEGDIVSADDEKYIVHYNEKTLSFDLKYFNERNQCPLYYLYHCKVIGNIHEGVKDE